MNRDYKIYFNDSYLLLTADRSQINKNFSKVLMTETEVNNFFSKPDLLFDGMTNGNILALTPTPGAVMCAFMEQPEIVIAGGGIVTNELNQILLIHRKGKWDMPKGKIELNEEIISGAKREVEEETGVKIQVVHDKPVHTYHTYTLKGKKCLKETSWYKMESYANQLALSPQLEEGIDKVVWVNPNELYIYKENCYRLIWDLLEPYC